MVKNSYVTRNPCFKAGRTIAVKGLMLHSIGCPQPDPNVFVKNWNRESYDSACVHGFIGAEETIITLPCMETAGKAMRGWHGGGSSNNTHLGFEMTEPANIKYVGGATFTCADKAAAISFVERTTKNAVLLFADLCRFHGLNPLTDIVSHAEGHALGIATNHGDPDHLWAQLGMNYNMDSFRRDVAAAMKAAAPTGTGDNPGQTYKKATEWCKEKHIFNGDGKGNYDWQKPITREQVAQIMYNAFKNIL